ncbi:MAG: MogA/MoaB family molybdenum cofactor biosynthesis protein [Syntrophales bacterium]|jgi:molybdenum cofactor synthesis domain-containing protein|nr:MogA/MoaB family molybdenum cofactor biosynthesis protein [Syntrophales bacterium]MDD4338313.1 MogA/MoaB family molybdenum cofactor biosynthesis protein [Syntrophales bacterium]HPB71214.1 MogA/MoaB family molybdenum cofactor biosynthesis protein [Syntrophales bacterium]HQN24791.1 MogA/MoaB family molybdenum cofactor biosynthesis protein [Syntrophales bacterium]HQP29256.1 MogA/MoaB family molybdenum cofactor biosynthesis protein [Syntrophales bacterium]
MDFRAAVVTLSDKGARGEREDLSGAECVRMLEEVGIPVADTRIIPDERLEIERTLIALAAQGLDLVVTTGGTGVSPRDVTPEATLAVIDRTLPGMAEAMRLASLAVTPHAMLSRAVAGLRNRTLIINLPGSPRGVRENLAVVLPALRHALEKIRGDESDCATP